MVTVDKNNEGYFYGDKVRMTGKKDDTTYSITFYEFEFLEGHNKGQLFINPAEFKDAR